MKDSKPANTTIEIMEISKGYLETDIVGESPICLKAMSLKTRGTLVIPSGKKTTLEKQTKLKHNPLEEYRDSTYRFPEDSSMDTVLGFPAVAFKRAMMTTTKNLSGESGITGTDIGRLVHVEADEGSLVMLYGIPEMLMPVTRMKDQSRTPDIQARAIIPHWACRLRITYVQPLITEQTVGRLLGAAGQLVGVGDGRTEKGKLDYGRFRMVSHRDKELRSILKHGRRRHQLEALRTPACHDLETSRLFQYFNEELARRQKAGSSLRLPEQQRVNGRTHDTQ